MSSSPTFLDPIVVPLLVGETVLDVGCGYGRWGSLIHSNYWEAGRLSPPTVDGIDAFTPNVDFCATLPFYRNVRQHVLPHPLDGAWDTVLACEIIEHIEQVHVLDVLSMFERVARRRVIITTPNWSDRRGGASTKLGFNDYEAHVSHISRAEFHSRGYKLRGAGFGNPDHWIDRSIAMMRRTTNRAPGPQTGESQSESSASESTGGGPAVPGSLRGRLQEVRAALGGVSRLIPSFAHTVVAYKDIV